MAAYVLGCDTARVRVTMEEKASNPRRWSASPAASLRAATCPACRTLLARYWIPAAASWPRPGIRPRLWGCQHPGCGRNSSLTEVSAGTGAAGWSPRPSREEATVEEHVVWMTTRQIKPGTLAGFERAWRPDTHPEGMLRAYAYWSPDEREIIGVSL